MTQPLTDSWADGASGATPITAARLIALRDLANAGLNGQLIPTLPAKTAAYTALARDQVLVDATNGSVVVTAPAAASGRFFGVLRVDSNLANTVTVQRAGTDVFTGGVTSVQVAVGQAATFNGVTGASGSPSTWVPKIEALAGHVHQQPSARYTPSAAQSLSNGTSTPLAFATAPRGEVAAVTRAVRGVGHQFTLNQAGRWALGAAARVVVSTASGEVYLSINDNSDAAIIAQGGAIGGVIPTRSVSVTDWFPAGQVVYVNAFQNAAASASLAIGGGFTQFTATYLGP